MSRSFRSWSTIAVLCVAAFGGARASAQVSPTLRFQVDQHGDFALIGNTLGQDCANGTPAPVVGTVGACGSDVSDSSPDVLWRADQPADGNAEANTAITAASARSTAVLSLPATATVSYARLYWAAISSTGLPDTGVSIERPGVFASTLGSDVEHTVTDDGDVFYESSADVTDLVQEHGVGAYRVGDVDTITLPNASESRAFVFWSMVVVYELADDPLRQLTVFDGLALTDTGSGVIVNVSGFLVPTAGIDAKLGVVAYGTDGQTGGDALSFNGTDVSDGLGGTNNFFNGSRTLLGDPVSVAGDLPQLTGGERSIAGADLDVIDVTDLVLPGSTSASITAKAGGDMNVMLGALVTAITTFRPNFNGSIKTATDLDGGLYLPGDVLRYTIDVINTGNDPAVDVVLEDALPDGLELVPGSLTVTDGFNDGVKTDQAGDDQGEYDADSHTVRVRLGDGADASSGGAMAIGGTATVIFDVTIGDSIVGLVQNQVTITAAGEMGTPEATYTTTDGAGSGTTDVIIDRCAAPADCPVGLPQCLVAIDPLEPNLCVECLSDANCSGTRPVCDLTDHACVACSDDDECTLAAAPACQLSGGPLEGACTECSAGNTDLCTSSKPQCLDQGICGCSDTDGDSECGATDSGLICNGPTGICVPGCSTAAGRNGCPAPQFCSDMTGAVGVCLPANCVDDDDCEEPTPLCDDTLDPDQCVQCVGDDDCRGTEPLCDTACNTCVECLDATDCDDQAPVCEDGTCVGCDDDDDCNDAALPACQLSGPRAGSCAQCSSANLSLCTVDRPICLPSAVCGCIDTDGDSECGASDSGRVCTGPAGICIDGCSTAPSRNDCPSDEVCNVRSGDLGMCVAQTCSDDDDCTMEDLAVCDLTVTFHVCVECLQDDDCDGDEVCDVDVRRCVGCLDDDDCDSDQICHPTEQVCTQCIDDGDCPGDELCDEITRSCVECIDDDHCANGQLCNPNSHQCVGCLDDDDCTNGRVCDPAERECVECANDDDCTNGQVCDPAARECVGCADDDDCSATEVCDDSVQQCVGCVADDDCDTDQVCDTATQGCVGCIDDDDCEESDRCDTQGDRCVACLDDDDCSEQTRCDGSTDTCVGCLGDDDCEGGEVCDVASATCVECTEANADACSADGVGAHCLDDNTCGCTTDSACGEDDSGRVCDADAERCTEGCRGDDGNGCPSGMTCSSDDSEIGECEPEEPMPDGVIEGGGCDCSVPSAGRHSPPPAVFVGLSFLASRIRRRLRR